MGRDEEEGTRVGAREGEQKGQDGELQGWGFEEWRGQSLEGHGQGLGWVGRVELSCCLCVERENVEGVGECEELREPEMMMPNGKPHVE